VGKLAEQMLDHEETEQLVYPPGVKRHLCKRNLVVVLGERKVTPLDVTVEVLRKLKKDSEELLFHADVPRAVITVPATFDQLEQDSVREAGARAGFQEVALLEEPVAAALAYAHEGLKIGRRVLVYDLGAGTFDLALLACEDGQETFALVLPPRGLR
jgi:molecular chaperone DnaK